MKLPCFRANESGILPTPTNLWHLLTVEKRVEAAEEGIDKLTSLIETLVTQNSLGRSAILTEKEMDQYKEKMSKATLKDIQTTCQLVNKLGFLIPFILFPLPPET